MLSILYDNDNITINTIFWNLCKNGLSSDIESFFEYIDSYQYITVNINRRPCNTDFKKSKTGECYEEVICTEDFNINKTFMNNNIYVTPLYIYLCSDNPSVNVVNLMLNNDANPNIGRLSYGTVLHLCVKRNLNIDILNSLLYFNRDKTLLQSKYHTPNKITDINAVDNNINTPLIIACFDGNYDYVKALLIAGANPNILCAEGGVIQNLKKHMYKYTTPINKIENYKNIIKILKLHGAKN